ncbi:MAG: preprotein translocase subunit SecY [Candidatus Moranbacteria bacterium]|nr:preprotein translocase subunit SecY [Candidatus Moranbacteria bacterium]
MIKKFKNVFLIKELRSKLLFIIFVLVVFRLAANIPLPGVDMAQLNQMMESNSLLGMLNMFSGGGLSSISIVLLGVGPYITASIIMQLLTMISPKMEQMYKEEGEAGRNKFNMITRLLTVPLAIMQTFAMISLLKSNGIFHDLQIFNLIGVVITATAGTIFLMWLGEIITEKGLGNGVSILIFAGIVSSLPTTLMQLFQTYDSSQLFTYVAFLGVIVVTILGVVFITEGQRIIPISYARRMSGGAQYGGSKTHLPLKVNQAGVIPIIFAVSLVMFPRLIGEFMGNSQNEMVHNFGVGLVNFFANNLYYGIIYFSLVAMFTYFYTAVVFDPQKIADNLQRQGGYIQGIRPGKETIEFLGKIVNRITLAGAIFLGIIAILPIVVQSLANMPSLSVGGASVLIVVSVVIEMIKQIDSQLMMRDYDRL